MEIASAMQSKAMKKMLRAQRREAQTIHTVVEIFSSLLPETKIDSLSTPIEKLDHLVTSTEEKMKSIGEAAIYNIEKEYEKRRIETLIKAIDRDRVGLTINMEQIKEALQTEGKIMSTICNFSLFLDDIDKKRKAEQKELKFLSE